MYKVNENLEIEEVDGNENPEVLIFKTFEDAVEYAEMLEDWDNGRYSE